MIPRRTAYQEKLIEEIEEHCEQTRNILEEAEQHVENFYSDRLQDIDNLPRGQVPLFDVNVVSIRVEDLRALVDILTLQNKALSEETLRIKVFYLGSEDYKRILLVQRASIRDGFRATLNLERLSADQQALQRCSTYDLDDRVCRNKFVHYCQHLELDGTYPRSCGQYLIFKDKDGRLKSLLGDLPEKYPERPYVSPNAAILHLHHYSVRLNTASVLARQYSAQVAFGQALLTPKPPLIGRPTPGSLRQMSRPFGGLTSISSRDHHTSGASPRLTSRRNTVPPSMGDETERIDVVAQVHAGGAVKNLQQDMDQEARRDYFEKNGYSVDESDPNNLKYYFIGTDGQRKNVGDMDEAEEKALLEDYDVDKIAIDLSAQVRRKMDESLQHFRNCQPVIEMILSEADAESNRINNQGDTQDKWPEDKMDFEPAYLQHMRATYDADVPANMERLVEGTLGALQKWSTNTLDAGNVERYNRFLNQLRLKVGLYHGFVAEMSAHGVLDGKKDLAKRAKEVLTKLGDSSKNLICKFPNLPTGVPAGKTPTTQDLERITRLKAEQILDDMCKKYKIKKAADLTKERKKRREFIEHEDLGHMLSTIVGVGRGFDHSTPSSTKAEQQGRTAAKGQQVPPLKDNTGGPRGGAAGGAAGGAGDPPGGGGPPDKKEPDDYQGDPKKKKKKKKKDKKAKRDRVETEEEKDQDRRRLLYLLAKGGDPDDDPSSSSSSETSTSTSTASDKTQVNKSKKGKANDKDFRDRLKRDRRKDYMKFNYYRAGIPSDDSDPFDSVSEPRDRQDRSPTPPGDRRRKAQARKQKKEAQIKRIEAAERKRKYEDRMQQEQISKLVEALSFVNLPEREIARCVTEALVHGASQNMGRQPEMLRTGAEVSPILGKDIKPCDAVPVFSGADDGLAVKRFLKEVDLLKIRRGWGDAFTAEQVRMKLQGQAKMWMYNNSTKEFTHKYSTLRPKLLERFYSEIKLSEKIQVRQSLTFNPTKHNNHQDFFDEISSKEDVLFDNGELDVNWQETHTLEECKNEQFLQLFLLGAAPSVRQKILEQKAETLKQCLAAARTYEAALKGRDFREKRHPGGTYQVEAVGLDPELWEAYGYSEDAQMQILAVQKGDLVCFYCGEKGHPKRECPKLTADKAAGTIGPDASGKFAGQPPRQTAAVTGPPSRAPFPRAGGGQRGRRTFRMANGSRAPRGRLVPRRPFRRPAGRGRYPNRTGQVYAVEDDQEPEEENAEGGQLVEVEDQDVWGEVFEDENTGRTYYVNENEELVEMAAEGSGGQSSTAQVSSIALGSGRSVPPKENENTTDRSQHTRVEEKAGAPRLYDFI